MVEENIKYIYYTETITFPILSLWRVILSY